MSIRIPDFLEIIKLYNIQNEKMKQLEAETTIQHMITLNQQNLLEDSQLVGFFRNLEVTDISSYFEKEELILNKFKRPRLMARFNEIPSYQRQIRHGIVHEICVNTNHPEEYTEFIPDICSTRVNKYASWFRNTFFFRV